MMSNGTKNIMVIPSIFFLFYLFSGKSLYNFVLVSAVQQGESVIITYILQVNLNSSNANTAV